MYDFLAGLKILVVEDDAIISMATELMLADCGCNAIAFACSVQEALAAIEAQRFDAVLLDLNLNGTLSDPVAAILKRQGVPFIVSSGYAPRTGGEASGAPTLPKPYMLGDLVVAFKRLLGNA
jgi:CheY-like chemotaxis protein